MQENKKMFVSLTAALDEQAARLNEKLQAEGEMLLCDESAASALEALLFARCENKEAGAMVLCCDKVEHSAERVKEKVILSAVEKERGSAYLNWLLEENTFVSALACSSERLLVEENAAMDKTLAWEQAGVCFAADLAPHVTAHLRMKEGARAILPAAAYLCGLNTVRECLEDETARDYLAHALADEVGATLQLERQDMLRHAADVFMDLYKQGDEKLTDMARDLIGRYAAYVLPSLALHVQQKNAVPPCLCFALSALIMYYAGARSDGKGGYQGVREEEYYPVYDDAENMQAFTRMSCDMDCDSLAYAVLSDWEMWNADLRGVPGLVDGVTGQLRDIQLLGSKTALKVAVEEHD